MKPMSPLLCLALLACAESGSDGDGVRLKSVADIAPGELVVSEIMANPSGCADKDGEWIEIYNASDRTLALDGLFLRDADGHEQLLKTDATVDPGAFAVLGRGEQADWCEAVPFIPDAFYGDGMYLNNGGDSVEIVAFDGNEDVVIDATAFYEQGVSGLSLELLALPAAIDGDVNDDAAFWERSICILDGTDQMATPGDFVDGCYFPDACEPALELEGIDTFDFPGELDGQDVALTVEGEGLAACWLTEACEVEVEALLSLSADEVGHYEGEFTRFNDALVSAIIELTSTEDGSSLALSLARGGLVLDGTFTAESGEETELAVFNLEPFCSFQQEDSEPTEPVETLTVDALQAGDLVVTEIMQNPSAAADVEGEWFELHNTLAQPVHLLGLEVRDDDDDVMVIDGDVVVEAGGYVVFAAGDEGLSGVAADHVYDTGNFLMSNRSDELLLVVGGLVIDRVAWDDGETFPDPEGVAMVLDPEVLDAELNDDGAAWCDATSSYGLGDLGTPGAPNDVCEAEEAPAE